MDWFLNDASLQGQFGDEREFEAVLKMLLGLRAAKPEVRRRLRTTRSFPHSKVTDDRSLRDLIATHRDKDLKRVVFDWLDRSGPFVDDERLPEADDYFEYDGLDVTVTGLGEAARRTKADYLCTTFSFPGGAKDFANHPLEVDHGLPDDRLGRYPVANIWDANDLATQAEKLEPAARNWTELVEVARRRYANLEIGPLDKNAALSREPFEASIRDRALELLQVLNEYVGSRGEAGEETDRARELIQLYFVGDNALFTGESSTNRSDFKNAMTFSRASGEGDFLAHWHGKIRHRFFRLHFEWPLDGTRHRLEVFYLGPKLTKG